MKSACPNCGAPIEFRFDDSFVRVCDSCHSAVLRTDRALESLGKVGDLAPLDSPLRLFGEGKDPAGGTFLLVGMAQLKHSAGGIWQEWYAKGDGGKWSWLAEAQGRYYLTQEVEGLLPIPFASLRPGARLDLGGTTYTVGELGEATYVSARGEIPYRLEPAETFRFADLADGQGKFATIDYGVDDGDPPKVYIGTQITLAQLGISGGEEVPDAPSARGRSAKLACPECNGALELRAPDASLRVACPYCNSLVSVEGGNLSVLAKLARKPVLAIPLGLTGTFPDGELMVIGFVQRSAQVDGSWYPFDEYLLYGKAVGFRWLVCSDGHWNYVQPIVAGAVDQNAVVGPTYEGVAFKLFQNAPLRVDAVYGELYWQVAIGDLCTSQDYVAPPAMLSVEQTRDEQNWSLSTYWTQKQVRAAFAPPKVEGAAPAPATELPLTAPSGIAPNQVFRGHGWGLPMGLAFALLCGIGIYGMSSAKEVARGTAGFTIPPGAPAPPSADPTAEAPGSVMFSDKFHLDAGKNIEITLQSNLSNTWLYAAVDLVNDTTGDVISFDTNLEHYAGFEDGESWSEGSNSTEQMIGPQRAGDYVLRVEAQHGAKDPQQLLIGVRQDVFRGKYFWIAFGILGVPLLIMWLWSNGFKKKQWQDSNTIFHGSDDDD